LGIDVTGKDILSAICDTKVKVVIIDARDGVSQALRTILRELKFASIEHVPTFGDFVKHLSRYSGPTWVLTTLHEVENYNGLEFVRDIHTKWSKSNVRVTFFLSAEQQSCLPVAYQFGLLSWHNAEYSVRYLEKEFREFLTLVATNQFDDVKVAATYYRRYLMKQKNWDELINLEKRLAACYFKDYEQKLALAEAYLLAGQTKQAGLLIEQISYLEPEFAERATDLYGKYIKIQDSSQATFAERYNIKTAVIIDHDDREANVVEDGLRKLGVADVIRFVAGDEAWLHIKELDVEPDLIIQEWQLKGVNGPTLIQRVRSHGFKEVPIVLISSLLKKSDAALVRDMAIYQVLAKPLREKQVVMGIAWALKQYREPTEALTLEKKIIGFLKSKNKSDALSYIEKYKTMPEIDENKLKYLYGNVAFYDGNYKEAVVLLTEFINQSPSNSTEAMALVSRALLKLGDFKASMQFMEKVCDLSPGNIERICEMAEMNLRTDRFEEARRFLDQAITIDAENPATKQTALKQAIITGDEKVSLTKYSPGAIDDALAFYNNFAVSKTRNGKFSEGIDLYKTFLNLVKDLPEYQAIGNYNLGLAHIRKGDPALGSVYIKRAVDIGESRVYDRALILQERLEQGAAKGETLRTVPQRAVGDWEDLIQVTVSNLSGPEQKLGLKGIYVSFPWNAYSRTLLKLKKEKTKLAS
jgi:DNA-binding response OmpR family regulator/thioredoxin-like negative regulator of GroEL